MSLSFDPATGQGADTSVEPLTLPHAGSSPAFVPPTLAVVVPSYNERDNIELLYLRVAGALGDLRWEMIVVDDNSPDGTAALVNELSRVYPDLRCLQRFGRRGLASACIEGMAATAAPYVAIIDADLQHDEAVLPVMLAHAEAGADLVVGSRFAASGSVGEGLSRSRESGSRLATRLAQLITGNAVSDPMSGFFLVRREVALRAAPRLSKDGFKVLMDLIVTTNRMGVPLKVAEVPYVFRPRHAGESKMSPLVVIQYLGLWFSKLTGGTLPPSFLLFGLVGGTGVAVHLGVLSLLTAAFSQGFVASQVAATLAAMTWNFWLNNNLTYADRKLRGMRMVRGLLSFFAICALGGLANVSVASTIYQWDQQTLVAGLAGAIMSSVFNYAVTRAFTWK